MMSEKQRGTPQSARVTVACAAAAYAFGASFALAGPATGSLWLIGYWAVLAPLAAAAGWYRMRARDVIVAYVLLTVLQYIGVTVATHSSFNGESQNPSWYTPIAATAIYAGVICLFDAVPVGAVYLLSRAIRSRLT